MIWESEVGRFSIAGEFMKTKVEHHSRKTLNNTNLYLQVFALDLNVKPREFGLCAEAGSFYTEWDKKTRAHWSTAQYKKEQALRRKYYSLVLSSCGGYKCPLCFFVSPTHPELPVPTEKVRWHYSQSFPIEKILCHTCGFDITSRLVFQCDIESLISHYTSSSSMVPSTTSSSVPSSSQQESRRYSSTLVGVDPCGRWDLAQIHVSVS